MFPDKWCMQKKICTKLACSSSKEGYPNNIFSYFSTKTYVKGTQSKIFPFKVDSFWKGSKCFPLEILTELHPLSLSPIFLDKKKSKQVKKIWLICHLLNWSSLSGELKICFPLFSDTLLCHDDELEGRRIAYIFYLVNAWTEQDGGTLDLYNIDGILFSSIFTLNWLD